MAAVRVGGCVRDCVKMRLQGRGGWSQHSHSVAMQSQHYEYRMMRLLSRVPWKHLRNATIKEAKKRMQLGARVLRNSKWAELNGISSLGLDMPQTSLAKHPPWPSH
jgi:hypothetical protein